MPFSRQLEKIKQGKIWRFFGGIKPSDRKATTNSTIEELAIPSLITLPLDRHLGAGGQILVRIGDYVKAGQPLTLPGGNRNVPLHASTSGHVTGIGMQLLPHPSGFLGRCITIKPDGLDTKVADQPMPDWQERTPRELLDRIRMFGVEGLGGAQFQTAAKIEAALEEAKGDCNIFIVNGAECEPVATCDDRLMQERAADIALGIEVVRKILQPKAIIVAIEDNKPKALEAMKAAVAEDVMVRKIPTIYPSGAARNLIKICTGIEIPYHAHTSECGIVVDNVETVFAIKQAVVDGIPLIKRVVTVDGMTLGRRGNALVRLGTSVRFVLNAYKLNPERRQRVILGGPFMGFTLPSIDVPITKSCTCVFAPSNKEVEVQPEEMNCIRCGRCARVCPSRLVPYQLYALSRASQHKKTKSCGMMDCTECGCCSYVCPSKIALTNQFRKEKAILRLLDDAQRRNIRAKERMTARNERLQKEKEAMQKRRAAALARMAENQNASTEELQAKRAQAIALARQRAAAKRNAQAALNGNTAYDVQSNTSTLGANEFVGSKLDASSMANVADMADNQAFTNQDGESAALFAQSAHSNDANSNGVSGENASDASANSEGSAENTTITETLPNYLRKTSQPKHATPLDHWQPVPEQDKDLRVVENPPAQEHKESIEAAQRNSLQQRRHFLTPGKWHLPKKLFRKDLTSEQIAQIEKAELEAELAASQPRSTTKNMFGLPLTTKLPGMDKVKAAQAKAQEQEVATDGVAKNKTAQAQAQDKAVATDGATKDMVAKDSVANDGVTLNATTSSTASFVAPVATPAEPNASTSLDTKDSSMGERFKFTYGNERLEEKSLATRRLQTTVGGSKVQITIAHAANMQEAEYLANMHPALDDSVKAPLSQAETQAETQAANQAEAQSAQGSNAQHATNAKSSYDFSYSADGSYNSGFANSTAFTSNASAAAQETETFGTQTTNAQVGQSNVGQSYAQAGQSYTHAGQNSKAGASGHTSQATPSGQTKVKQQRFGDWVLPKQTTRWVAPGAEQDQDQ